jgi:hypothetical protein
LGAGIVARHRELSRPILDGPLGVEARRTQAEIIVEIGVHRERWGGIECGAFTLV